MIKSTKCEKAVTLIALVITIIVLLILAGVSMNVIFGDNNLFGQAQKAKESTAYSVAKEKLDLALSQLRVNKMEQYKISDIHEFDIEGNENYQTDINVLEQLSEDSLVVRVDGKYDFQINSNGSITSLQQYKIQYVLGGGTLQEGSPTVFARGTIVPLKKAVKAGAVFAGWYNTADYAGTEITKIEGTANSDITLYAKWMNETDSSYFVWSEDSTTLLGFSTLGLEKYNNNEIIDLIIPKEHNGVTLLNIGESAFSGNGKIETIIIPDTVVKLQKNAFQYSNNLKNLQMPISINQFGDAGNYTEKAFSNSTKIEKIKLTYGNETVFNLSGRDYEFTPWYYSRNNNPVITLEEGITTVGTDTFRGCTTAKFNLPSTLHTVRDYAFYACSGGEIKVEELANLKQIGAYAFSACLDSIVGTLDLTNAEQIGEEAFSSCHKIHKVIIPDTMAVLSKGVFKNTWELYSIQMPISIDVFTGISFENCTTITDITLTPGTGNVLNLSGRNPEFTPWYYSRNNNLTITLQEGITTVGSNTFYGCTTAKFNLPSTLHTVRDYAFHACSGGEIKVEELANLKQIGAYAFSTCLDSIVGTLDLTNAEQIGDEAFSSCHKIHKIIIPNTMTALGKRAFKYAWELYSIEMPMGIDLFGGGTLDDAVFGYCKEVKEVKFTPGTGGVYNFSERGSQFTPWYISKNNNLTMTLEKGITTIGSYTFNGLSNVTFNYTGNAEEWSNVTINSNNSSLTSRTVNFI